MSPGVFPIERKKMYLFFAVVDLFVAFFRFAMLPKEPLSFHVAGYVLSVIGFFLLWESILFTGKKLENKFPIESHPYLRFFLQTLITYVLLIFPSFFYTPDVSELVRTIGYLFYFLVAAVLNLIYFGVNYFFNWKNDLVSLANMRREQTAVKYDALRNQLNPHFLFNALTSLNSLIFDDPQLASDFLQQLSKVYRYVLQNKENETVSLSTELEFIAHYTFLLKTRFNNAIEFNIQLDESAKEKEIVPVTLQVLIENAVKHNIISPTQPLKISITEQNSFLVVENNLSKKAQVETSNKQGLENLKSFYKYLDNRPIEIIENRNTFTIKIPLI